MRDDNDEVPTTSGRLRGERLADGGTVFRGVPYALAPTGGRRLRPPAAFDSAGEARDCRSFGGTCPQLGVPFDYLGPVVSADQGSIDEATCLNLNVWAPAERAAPRPVMVFLHGGAFSMGGTSLPLYDGAAFARSGVVYVSVNYRVGPLGWLYLGELFDDARGTGNLGLLDQVAALFWIQRNIAAFGGDPDNVTIFGESAGGFSVATLLAVPAARGLFRRAIVQSGSGRQNLSPAAATKVARAVLDAAGIAPGDWAALRRIDWPTLVGAEAGCWSDTAALFADEPGNVRNAALPFSPVIDGDVLPALAERAVASGSAPGVDLLIGTCADEFRGLEWGLPPDAPFRRDRDLGDLCRPLERTDDEVAKIYRQERQLGDRADIVSAALTDACFAVPSAALAKAQAEHGRVWMYRLEWRTPVDDYAHGTPHAIDLPFVFKHLDFPGMHGPNPPQRLADAMHAAWVRFAATGDPNGGDLPAWPRYDPGSRRLLAFGEEPAVGVDFSPALQALWDLA